MKLLGIISYSQASRRFNKLNIKINDCRADKSNMEDIEIAIDSTSISIYNNTPGHSKENSEDRKYRGYEQVRKLHAMLNIKDKKVIAAKYSDGVYSDHYGACDLLEEVNSQHARKHCMQTEHMTGTNFINCVGNMISRQKFYQKMVRRNIRKQSICLTEMLLG
jgi:hypothetical protein